ncbi:MAG: hypothetical protein KF908_14885 [Nitrosomonas sp.]|nr:hypothetical protein [Nitrosomonas sp.]MCW5607788.1 hypothetical protein [Nitrosomonas sp.]
MKVEKQLYDEYVTAKAEIKQLQQKAEDIQQKKADYLARKNILEIDLERAKRQNKNDEKTHILGQTSDAQINASREKVRQIETELGEINIFLDNVDSVINNNIPNEITKQVLAMQTAKKHYCAAVRDPILEEIRNNETLKDKLIQAYIAHTSGGLDNNDWYGWIRGILKAPTHEELQLHLKAFKESHNL